MIRPSVGSRDLSRRAFERISIIVIEPVSSTQIGAFISLSHAAVRRGQSSGFSLPVRRLCDSTFASLHIIRCVTSLFDISSVNSATGTSWRTARFCAMFRRERRLPHRRPGRDDDQVPRLEARRELVELLEAGGTAGDVGAGLVQVHDALEALLQQPFDVAEVARDPLLGEVEDDLLGPVDEVRRSRPGRSWPSRAISAPARTRPRSVAISRTIRA